MATLIWTMANRTVSSATKNGSVTSVENVSSITVKISARNVACVFPAQSRRDCTVGTVTTASATRPDAKAMKGFVWNAVSTSATTANFVTNTSTIGAAAEKSADTVTIVRQAKDGCATDAANARNATGLLAAIRAGIAMIAVRHEPKAVDAYASFIA